MYNAHRLHGKVVKWQNFYKDVSRVTQKLNDVAYIVDCPKWCAPKIVHVDKLKKVVNWDAAI